MPTCPSPVTRAMACSSAPRLGRDPEHTPVRGRGEAGDESDGDLVIAARRKRYQPAGARCRRRRRWRCGEASGADGGIAGVSERPGVDLALSLGVKCQEVVHPSHQWVACGWRPKLTPHEEARMNVHKNARTTPQSRAEIVRRIVAEHQSTGQVAAAFGISARTVRKWVARAGSAETLTDRSSRPHDSPGRTPAELRELIERLRRQHWTGAEIARALDLSSATVARYLRRLGLARVRDLAPPAPVVRYEYRRPGALVHIDIKKLGRIGRVGHRITGDRRRRVRGIGWEFVHVAIDDATRLAYVEVLPDEHGVTCVRFLWRTLAWFRRHGICVRRLMTDNGSGYRADVFTTACQGAGLRHTRTRPYTPRTNGKAERFIQTLLREWAYRRPYATSAVRRAAVVGWLHHYNWHHNHGSLHGSPPISRLLAADNLMRLHT